MEFKDWAIPVASGLIAVGMTMATVTASANDADDLADRVRQVEVKQASEESTKVMVKQNTERLERLENIMEKLDLDTCLTMRAPPVASCKHSRQIGAGASILCRTSATAPHAEHLNS